MLQLSATLKAKTALLEKEVWGHFATFLAGSRTSGLWEFLEDLFGEVSKAEEEEGPLSKKSQPEDETSTRLNFSFCYIIDLVRFSETELN